MFSHAASILLISFVLALAALLAFTLWVIFKYVPIIGRIFEEKPLFLPLRLSPEPGGEDVTFRTADGLNLAGSYFPATSGPRVGVLVFCHEYLSDRWSFRAYAASLRALGFDLFTFDFRDHGASDKDPSYRPMQWVTAHETADLRAALAYLRTRPDQDPAGFGLFGISRGGSAALVVGAEDPGIWGVITDGAFPTRGTMDAYIMRWAEIYITNPILWRLMPMWSLRLLGGVARLRLSRRLRCRFPDVEGSVRNSRLGRG